MEALLATFIIYVIIFGYSDCIFPKMPPKQMRSKANKGAIQRLRHEISGVGIKIRPDPPAVTLRPWNNVSVVVPFTAGSTGDPRPFSITAVITQLRTQAGIYADSVVEVKFRELRVWGVPGGSLNLKIYDFLSTASTSPTLSEIRDVGNLSTRPKAGYVFPTRLATAPVTTGNEDVFVVTSSPSTNTNIITESHVLVSYRIV